MRAGELAVVGLEAPLNVVDDRLVPVQPTVQPTVEDRARLAAPRR